MCFSVLIGVLLSHTSSDLARKKSATTTGYNPFCLVPITHLKCVRIQNVRKISTEVIHVDGRNTGHELKLGDTKCHSAKNMIPSFKGRDTKIAKKGSGIQDTPHLKVCLAPRFRLRDS